MAETIWANKADLTDMTVNEEAMPELGDGEVRLRVESFAVTANNVTYAVIGDQFGYWNFFPAQAGFGVVPMWGHAHVEASRHSGISEGERVYGYLPMGTHLDVLPDRVSEGGFIDAAAHRQPMSPIYNQYSRLAHDPEHDATRENERMLFAPLFKTGFLIEDMMRRNDWFGADTLIMTSASSKTALGLASCVKQSSPYIRRVGLTSAGNVEFVKETGLYDAVLAYDAIAELPARASVSVDFAGSSAVLRSLHTHLGDQLKYSCLVGATHVDARGAGSSFAAGEMAGAKPVLFFAPDHAVAAVKAMGPKGFGQAVAASWAVFLGEITGSLQVEERTGVVAAAEAFQAIYTGVADAAVGVVVRV